MLTTASPVWWCSFGLVLNTDLTWQCYLNGILAARGSDMVPYDWFASRNYGYWLNLFLDSYSTTTLYGGNLDTLLLYAKALDAEQVAWLHGNT